MSLLSEVVFGGSQPIQSEPPIEWFISEDLKCANLRMSTIHSAMSVLEECLTTGAFVISAPVPQTAFGVDFFLN